MKVSLMLMFLKKSSFLFLSKNKFKISRSQDKSLTDCFYWKSRTYSDCAPDPSKSPTPLN